jgi:predicted DsbA family dithiol-disulfide isomerase
MHTASNLPELYITVFSDYICPFCYIGNNRVVRLEEQYNLKINWCGLEIHPETPPEGMPASELGYTPKQWQQMMHTLQQLATEENINIRAHDFTTNSHKALLLAEAAKSCGKEIFYRLHNRLFHDYFSLGKNIGDEEVLRELANDSGIPEEIVEGAWTHKKFEARLKLNYQAAQKFGVSGTPTFIIGDQVISGAVPYQQLVRAAEETRNGDG